MSPIITGVKQLTKYYDKVELDTAMGDMCSQMMNMERRLAKIGVSRPHLTCMGLYVETALGVAHDPHIPAGARLSEVRSIKQSVDELCMDLEDEVRKEREQYQSMHNVVYVNFAKKRRT